MTEVQSFQYTHRQFLAEMVGTLIFITHVFAAAIVMFLVTITIADHPRLFGTAFGSLFIWLLGHKSWRAFKIAKPLAEQAEARPRV